MVTKLGVVMDPIGSIRVKKDSTFALLLAAQARGWRLAYMEQGDLSLRNSRAFARMRELHVQDDPRHWYSFGLDTEAPLDELDVVLMRKDPPFDAEYVYTTQLLEIAERRGTLVVNRPQGLRDINEKLTTAWFTECTVPSLVTRNAARLREFLSEHDDIVVKPLGLMGGTSVFRVRKSDPNVNVIIETLTEFQTRFAMAQRFIPQIVEGDKRILLVDGEPVPYALARVPSEGESRGNLATGGQGVGIELSDRDRWICAQVGPVLRERGQLFVGIDVIGDYLTEVNVTSPTCIRELDALFGLDIAAQVLDKIETRLSAKGHV